MRLRLASLAPGVALFIAALFPTAARADDALPDGVRVHVRSPTAVDVTRSTPTGNATVCTTPCDFITPSGARFEIAGRDVHRAVFTVHGQPGEDVWLTVSPSRESSRHGGAVAGGVFMGLGTFMAAWGLLRVADGNLSLPVALFSQNPGCSESDPAYSQCATETSQRRDAERTDAHAEIRSGTILMAAGIVTAALGSVIMYFARASKTTVRREPVTGVDSRTPAAPASSPRTAVRDPPGSAREPRGRATVAAPLLTIHF
jgi:hypothetical protein